MVSALAPEQRLIRHLLGERVGERILLLGAPAQLSDQLRSLQLGQVMRQVLSVFCNRLEHTMAKRMANHCSDLQRMTCVGIESVQSGRDNAVQCLRDVIGRHLTHNLPPFTGTLEHAPVD